LKAKTSGDGETPILLTSAVKAQYVRVQSERTAYVHGAGFGAEDGVGTVVVVGELLMTAYVTWIKSAHSGELALIMASFLSPDASAYQLFNCIVVATADSNTPKSALQWGVLLVACTAMYSW